MFTPLRFALRAHDRSIPCIGGGHRRPIDLKYSANVRNITLHLPDDLDLELQRQSAALGISKSDLAREALKRYLHVTEFRSLRAKLMASARARGINPDEEATDINDGD